MPLGIRALLRLPGSILDLPCATAARLSSGNDDQNLRGPLVFACGLDFPSYQRSRGVWRSPRGAWSAAVAPSRALSGFSGFRRPLPSTSGVRGAGEARVKAGGVGLVEENLRLR